MSTRQDSGSRRLDDAARAGWLYYVAGNNQEEIAQKLGVSRPTAQRLVSLAVSERLITFRFEHPIAACMELATRLTERYSLKHCEVCPTDPADPGSLAGIAASAASFIEQRLASPDPVTLALGTGRALRAAVDQVQPLEGPHHTLVALVGNIAPDGSASFFDALARLADVTKARHYPIPLPVVADSEAERDMLISLQTVRKVHALAAGADTILVGVGQLDLQAQQFIDGFISRDELLSLMKLGAVGEVTGWGFDADGQVLDQGVNLRVTSAPLRQTGDRLAVGVAVGASKVKPIHCALAGHILTGLITDEQTAKRLLALR